jgi:hypothetical protein
LPFNVNSFRANGLILGGARPSLFEVFFPTYPPGLLAGGNLGTKSSFGDKLTFLCNSGSLPASRVDAIPVFYFGRQIYFAGERSFEPWAVTILNDEDFKLRDFFEAWSNRMNMLTANITELSSDPRDYKIDFAKVMQWGKDGTLLREYNFFGMFPVIVGDIALSWDQGNRIETFDVRFAYDWWEPASTGQPDQEQLAEATYDPGVGIFNDTNMTDPGSSISIPTNAANINPASFRVS